MVYSVEQYSKNDENQLARKYGFLKVFGWQFLAHNR